MSRIASVVILYNPDLNIVENLKTYINQVEKIFIVDNSDKTSIEIISEIKRFWNVEYICNKLNLGIASALNIGAQKAIEEGYNYLLTMDQDSSAPEFMVEKLDKLFERYPEAAIITPYHLNKGFNIPSFEFDIEELPVTMTSGNLLSLEKFKIAGKFLDELFIDFVDHEYCLRLRSKGFKIIRANKIYLNHRLGKLEQKRFLAFNFFPSYHSPKRYYYRIRNRLYINKIYKNIFPDYVKMDKKRMLREIFEIILFEPNRGQNIKMFFKGYKHYKKNKFPIL